MGAATIAATFGMLAFGMWGHFLLSPLHTSDGHISPSGLVLIEAGGLYRQEADASSKNMTRITSFAPVILVMQFTGLISRSESQLKGTINTLLGG